MGGADRVTLNLLKSFDREKFDCELLLNRKAGVFFDEIPESIKVHEANSLNVLTMTFSIVKLIKKFEYDYVFSTSGGTNVPVVLAKIFSGGNNIKTVISERVNIIRADKDGIKQKTLRFLKGLTYRKADIVTAVSQELAEDIHRVFGVSRNRLQIVNNPIIDRTFIEERISPLVDIRFDKSKPSILTAVRLIPTKNVALLINAFYDIRDKTKANLYILGTGSEEDKLRSQSKALGLENRVVFLGFDKNPFKWMVNADVFVLPSNNEGMPGVLIQALACGTACISTNSKTGPKELIQDGINGFLVDVKDREGLAEKILEVLINEEVKSKFRVNALKGLERFEEQNALDSYFKILK
ncbi:glycosyltransferase [Roseivirga echinicomitans]